MNQEISFKCAKKSTAAGHNSITALHLKHLGPLGLRYLTGLFNLSIREACIPVIWCSANIVPVPKQRQALGSGN